MEQRPLFKNGELVSAVGFGAWPIGGGMGRIDDRVAISTIHAALDSGITLIDTAQSYLESERVIGKALKNVSREKYFLATKVSDRVTGDFSRKNILSAIDNSLKMLGVETIDLYQIHQWNTKVPIEESMQTMVDLRQAGKVRHIGVSNFMKDHMQAAMRTAAIQTNQLRYNLFDRAVEAVEIPFCEQQGIGVLAHSALAKGLLSGKYTPDWQFADDDERSQFSRFQGETFRLYINVAEELKALAYDKGVTLTQMSIAWILRQPAVSSVLVGAKSPQQIEGLIGVTGVAFAGDELDHIDRILGQIPAGSG